jgi:hypothetical protein
LVPAKVADFIKERHLLGYGKTTPAVPAAGAAG